MTTLLKCYLYNKQNYIGDIYFNLSFKSKKDMFNYIEKYFSFAKNSDIDYYICFKTKSK